MGIEDVFSKIIVRDETEGYESEVAPSLDVKGIVNSLTGIRNNILHQDETPTLTPTEIRKQSTALQKFASALVAELQSIVDDIEARVARA
jgi:hypothetical protein